MEQAVSAMQTKERLTHLKHQLEQELALLKQQTEPVELDQQAIGRVSRIDAMQQQEMAKSSYHHLEVHLSEVNKALQRFEEGEYGYCEECGNEIPPARLDIMPEVRLCVGCQEQHE